MDTRSLTLWPAAILLFMLGLHFDASANSVFIYGGDFNLPILDKPSPGCWMTEAAIEVPLHLTIYDLDVGINLTHTSVFDLQIFLQSPEKTRICLNMYDFKKDFFKGKNYIETIFDDEAELPIEKAKAPFTGRYRPKAISHTNLLKLFDSQDAYGCWRLQLYDMFEYDTGTLNTFKLMITAPEPTTAILLIFGAGLAILFRPRRT